MRIARCHERRETWQLTNWKRKEELWLHTHGSPQCVLRHRKQSNKMIDLINNLSTMRLMPSNTFCGLPKEERLIADLWAMRLTLFTRVPELVRVMHFKYFTIKHYASCENSFTSRKYLFFAILFSVRWRNVGKLAASLVRYMNETL